MRHLPAVTGMLLVSTVMAGSAMAQKNIVLQRQEHTTKAEMRSSIKAARVKKNASYNEKRAAESEKALSAFTLTVGGIQDGQPIPATYAYCTTNGRGGTQPSLNINPSITWSPPPEGTQSMVLLVVDKDVPASFEKANVPGETLGVDFPRQDFYHWVLVDIPPHIGGLMEGTDSNGIVEGGKPLGAKPYGISGQNDYALVSPGPHGSYEGPCPPWNDKRLHNYHFTIYALDIPSVRLPNPIKGKQAELAMRGHVLAKAEVVGTYTTNPDWLKNLRRKSRKSR